MKQIQETEEIKLQSFFQRDRLRIFDFGCDGLKLEITDEHDEGIAILFDPKTSLDFFLWLKHSYAVGKGKKDAIKVNPSISEKMMSVFGEDD